jgi:polygalacturonase
MSKNGFPFTNICDFGAVPDGKTYCGEAFSAAVTACTAQGGGTVFVPAGTFYTGPIHLASNINLHLEAGAHLRFSQDPADYPLVYTRWEGTEGEVYSPLIYGKDLVNVSVTGRGVLDGCGDFWWKGFRQKTLAYPRPRFISFENCNNLLIQGITLLNSPAWTVNPILCENVTVDGITIKNPADSPNTDGINPDSCCNVHISNCHVDVGDDCVTIKSGIESSAYRVPCENVTVTNCTMIHGHGGVVIGSEMSGGIKNVTITNCVFEGTDRGIRLKSRRGRGGFIEDLVISNIVMKDVICPFIMNLYYFCGEGGKEPVVWDKNPHPVTEATPAFRRIRFNNIIAREVKASAGFIYGLPEMPVADIVFDNIAVYMAQNAEPAVPAMMSHLEPMARHGFFCCNATDILFNNVKVSGHDGPAFQIEKAKDVVFNNCSSKTESNPATISLQEASEVMITGCRAGASGPFLELHGTEIEQVELRGNSAAITRERIACDGGATVDLVQIG